MVERDEFDALVDEMTQCKTSVHSKIGKIEQGQDKLETGQKKLEAGHKKLESAIHNQSLERKEANDEIKNILVTLVKQTADNTTFIASTKEDTEVKRRVKEELNLINKPKADLWHKIKMTAVTVITGMIVTGVASGIWLIIKMYMLLNGDPS